MAARTKPTNQGDAVIIHNAGAQASQGRAAWPGLFISWWRRLSTCEAHRACPEPGEGMVSCATELPQRASDLGTP